MQLPKRKPGKYTHGVEDLIITQKKFDQLDRTAKKLKAERPQAAAEVSRLAEMGDFSENAGYQQAKWHLRRLNNKLTKIEFILNHAEIIQETDNSVVSIGNTVTITTSKGVKTYTILGSSEINIEKGIISHSSPVGKSLLGCKVGDSIKIGNLGTATITAIS